MMDFLKSLSHPDEISALVRYKINEKRSSARETIESSADLRLCYCLLRQTSRSFSAVIQALDAELRDAVCIFYLVLRALDTVEDDMTIPMETKVPMLRAFHTYLLQPDWSYADSQEKDKAVLKQFPAISGEYRKLAPEYKTVISDICRRMGEGMVEYLNRSPSSLTDWDQYCHYVAGLVGIGLSNLFAASELESKTVGENRKLANSMGLFLQKTNIIRDYLEDVVDGREFWPKEVWNKYVDHLPQLQYPCHKKKALACLNELVMNALQHVPDCIVYMEQLQNQSVFNFCAIPQAMAIATLERCFNNYNVFRGVVKIRKGEAVKLMMDCTNIEKVKAIFHHFTVKMQTILDPADAPTYQLTRQVLNVTATDTHYVTTTRFLPLYMSFALMVAAITWNYYMSMFNTLPNVMSGDD